MVPHGFFLPGNEILILLAIGVHIGFLPKAVGVDQIEVHLAQPIVKKSNFFKDALVRLMHFDSGQHA